MANFMPGAADAQGRCMNWVKGNFYTYPDDFKDTSGVDILNVVDIYKCPTSKKRIIISNGVPDHTVKQGNGNIPCEIRSSSLMLLWSFLCVSSTDAQKATSCSDNMASFKPGATNAKGRCMNWVKGKSYTYPDDFKDASDVAILNVVDIYKCPTSKKRIIISNGVPDHTVKQGNGNIPCEIRWAITLPLVPEKPEGEIQEIPIRGIIAMSTNGVPAFGPQEVGNDNAVDPTGPIQDAQFWYGHATMQKVWHFHNPYMGKEAPDKDTLLGYALDGYPIYGPYPENSSVALDECNGIFINGQYQYHVLEIDAVDGTTTDYCKSGEPKEVNNWNYILGCYKGKTSET
eukprot:CAMPEP_0194345440 /NCGR_PEP_ID=MMETSP0171-20130528/104854_1 /TAXON_ID=218684 /ORGANISM="Corethron pennatum, Strain L29A3" /LENGTH=343 /DNA_ID=CAMNT_0039112417 /DNA_START=163 /DNA_END=1190 /DNA_ORIENTATION=+